MTNISSTKYRFINAIVYATLCLVALLCYFSILGTPFFADDFDVLARIKTGNLMAPGFFRPLSDFGIYIDYLTWKNNAFGYHLTSIFIHINCSFLLFVFSKKVFAFVTKDNTLVLQLAFCCAVLFLIYPYHNEAIVWIVGRGILLAAFFTMLAANFYLSNDTRSLIAASFAYFVALFGYESVVCFPVMMILVDYFIVSKEFKKSAYKSLFLFVPLLIYLVLRLNFIGTLIGAEGYFHRPTISFLFMNLLRLVERSILPPIADFKVSIIATLVIVIAAITVLLIWSKAYVKSVGILLLLFLISLIPVTIVGIDTHDTEGERFLYFPSLFFCLLIVYLLYRLFAAYTRHALIGLGVYWIIFLGLSNYQWKVAGKMTLSLVNEISKEKNIVYIIDLPDNYKGALIFRNGFVNAFDIMGKQAPANIHILTKKEIKDPADFSSNVVNTQSGISISNRFLILERDQQTLCKDSVDNKEYVIKNGDALYFLENGLLKKMMP